MTTQQRLQQFMKWFNTEFCTWWRLEYRADYINSYKAIHITRLQSQTYMLGSAVTQVVFKAEELGLTVCFESKDSKPLIAIT